MTISEPAQPSGAAHFLRRWLPWVVAAAAVLWLAFLADPHVRSWLGESRPKAVKNFAREVSFYGDWPALVVGALLVAGVGIVVKRRCTRTVCIMIVAASLAGLGANVLRATTGRTRPFKTEQAWHGPTISHSRNSFPSAHTSSAMGFFFALVLLAPRIGFALLPLAFLVGWSRIYLHQHHFSDVIGGLILGTAAAIFTCRVLVPRWDAYRSRKRALPAADDGVTAGQTNSSRQQI